MQRACSCRLRIAPVKDPGLPLAYDDPTLMPLVLYTATGGVGFVVQAWLLARRRRRLAAVPA